MHMVPIWEETHLEPAVGTCVSELYLPDAAPFSIEQLLYLPGSASDANAYRLPYTEGPICVDVSAENNAFVLCSSSCPETTLLLLSLTGASEYTGCGERTGVDPEAGRLLRRWPIQGDCQGSAHFEPLLRGLELETLTHTDVEVTRSHNTARDCTPEPAFLQSEARC